MAKIPLGRNVQTLVDDADLPLIAVHRWYAVRHPRTTYVVTKVKRRAIYMHRVILNAPRGSQVDHINGDGLDNRRINLRFATPSEQAANSAPKRKRAEKASRFKGIYWHKWKTGGCWRVELDKQIGGRRKRFIAYASIEEEAARLYDQLAKRHFGAFAKLNFP